MASLWTGQISSGSAATSISIDQQIVAKLAAGMLFPSIQLMVRDAADFTANREVKTRMIYNASGVYASDRQPDQRRGHVLPQQTQRGIGRARQEHVHLPAAVSVRPAPR